MVMGGVQKMKSEAQIHIKLLADRLAHALAGTRGRIVSIDSIRTLVALETTEWNSERLERASLDHRNGALIAGPSELFC
jgi:hypothetical protein